MDMASTSKVSLNQKLAFVALGISLISQTVSPCLALSLSNNSQKKTALQYEVYSKMSPGAGPQTNDLQKQEPQLDNSTAATAPKPVDLSPVTMDEGQKSETSLGPSEEGVLKATVKRDQSATSGPVDQSAILAPKSIHQSVNDKLLKNEGGISGIAKKEGLVPLALMPSEDEERSKSDVKFNAEKIELADLWDSTLARSQDIQFVVQKLMPNSNSGKTANVMMKMLSATVFGGMSMMTMMAPNMGVQAGTNMGASMVMQALNGVQGNADKKARLNQTEAIMLYKMVRDTADKVVVAFRDYKIELGALQRSNEQLTKLKDSVKDLRASQSPVEQLKLQQILDDKQSDIETKIEKVNQHRQTLIDLSGSEAVAKLDKQLEIDKQKIDDAGVQIAGSADQTAGAADGTLVAPTTEAVPH